MSTSENINRKYDFKFSPKSNGIANISYVTYDMSRYRRNFGIFLESRENESFFNILSVFMSVIHFRGPCLQLHFFMSSNIFYDSVLKNYQSCRKFSKNGSNKENIFHSMIIKYFTELLITLDQKPMNQFQPLHLFMVTRQVRSTITRNGSKSKHSVPTESPLQSGEP